LNLYADACCALLPCGGQVLPQGLAGAVGMFRNWTFTLFFCMSELWGDVCMGLLFWG
jgi:ATP/ADP translocase